MLRQNCLQLLGPSGMVNCAGQFDDVTYDPKIGMLKEDDGAENNQNSSPCYYSGNVPTMQPYTIAQHTLPSQNSQYEAAFQSLPSVLPGEFYDTNMLQAQMFNYMHGRK